MMFTLHKTFRFEAAHFLPWHDGKCRRLHGHSWVGKIVCAGDKLQTSGAKSGMLVDYGDMSAAVEELVEEKLDHYCLNETLPLDEPTSEAIAHWIFQQIKPRLPLLKAVIIEETCTSKCSYSE